MEAVSGFRLTSASATLRGYTRRAVKGAHYPAIKPDEAGKVEGVVYRNVPDPAWARLDRFEGVMYARRQVRIELDNDAVLHAATYVIVPKYLGMLEDTGWDFEGFQREGVQYYRRR